jgi:hypothetical protein
LWKILQGSPEIYITAGVPGHIELLALARSPETPAAHKAILTVSDAIEGGARARREVEGNRQLDPLGIEIGGEQGSASGLSQAN